MCYVFVIDSVIPQPFFYQFNGTDPALVDSGLGYAVAVP
jgi:hypothetical protein